MASGASGEVVHCPNCKEDVPKTLYCLNCGFPLYKEEQGKEEKNVPEEKAEPSTSQEDAVILVDEALDEKMEEIKTVTPELTPEVKPIEAPSTPVIEEAPPKPAEPTPTVEKVVIAAPPTVEYEVKAKQEDAVLAK